MFAPEQVVELMQADPQAALYTIVVHEGAVVDLWRYRDGVGSELLAPSQRGGVAETLAD